ncbi:DotD/TraH family lipoprotein [Pantoea sp. DY-5]|nr:DotD/TraH family lipoprotein [Pantoea sp. DY-5]
MKAFLILSLATLACGCQFTQLQSSRSQQPAVPPSYVSQQMMGLWQTGSLNQSLPLPVATIRADSDRVTLSWNGDALELLSALARARGLKFSYAGVRLPLPVDIEVQDVTYANLLRIIQMQTAWRATLVTYPGQMVLQFMPSLPAEPGRNHKGGRR